MGILIWIGSNTDLFQAALTPWTTLGPLAVMISFSLMQEGVADLSRHRSDKRTNFFPCLVLKRAEDIKPDQKVNKKNGMNINLPSVNTQNNNKVNFANVKRADMYAGDLILVRNREMVPADIVLLASSNENGSVYIETSSIDGETNLKLRTCPNMTVAGYEQAQMENLEQAVTRIAEYSALSNPHAKSALENPHNAIALNESKTICVGDHMHPTLGDRLSSVRASITKSMTSTKSDKNINVDGVYVATLTSELPNASVNTFSGKLTLPPIDQDSPSPNVPLGAENLLLRGAMLRNTEWAIGVACFTGKDTKLVKNSVKTPSKLSQLDILMNRTILLILFAMFVLCLVLAGLSIYEHRINYENLYYLAYTKDTGNSWPYLPDLPPPEWEEETPDFSQMFFTFITLTNNFVPLSLYVTVEFLVAYFMWSIRSDKDMYHEETELAAAARSTIVSDLGQIKYIFSDKTGTLTQNIMNFKRCSVDGTAYGSPVTKDTHMTEENTHLEQDPENPTNTESSATEYKELQHLLTETSDPKGGKLSFNAEMFLRVMGVCHTVVVEKDYDIGNDTTTNSSEESSPTCFSALMRKLKLRHGNSEIYAESAHSKPESAVSVPANNSNHKDDIVSSEKSSDGAPKGFAYQAESPDEGALVSAASLEYGFQLIARESNGIRLRCSSNSLLEDSDIVDGLKTGNMTPGDLASRTAQQPRVLNKEMEGIASSREEVWSVLAVNKFESDRKRMSILVRSPPELGSIPILFCKGADSAMLVNGVCEGANMIIGGEDPTHTFLSKSLSTSFANEESNEDLEEKENESQNNWKMNVALSIQAHLGDFASEGLRTLVLGIRVLSEEECEAWLTRYEAAANSIKDRDQRLKEVAIEIETKIHIVGATAIEDQLQKGVPETIAKLADAGIKLWVLTGDKRETAIEIGYSTKVLTPMMRLIEVADSTTENVKFLIAKEFLRLVKKGNLPLYQRASLEKAQKSNFRQISSCWRTFLWALSLLWEFVVFIFRFVFNSIYYAIKLGDVPITSDDDRKSSKRRQTEDPYVSRKAVRDLAESIIETHKSDKVSSLRSGSIVSAGDLATETAAHVEMGAVDDDEFEETPRVFDRAASARAMLQMRSDSVSTKGKSTIMADDLMSMTSANIDKKSFQNAMFLKKKRTIFEAIFAVDKEVRHGRLMKHLNPDYVNEAVNVEATSRALVIEGGALLHLLGDPILEEMLFAVASNCDSVIACRVSPKQKALLVNLVRNYVSPEPITLAIGDGANDVGMIQEAHVGVGVAGLEGQQAVNSSDFAIAQFRFLQELLLIHGRWNFMRLSKTVLFSFYKNALLVGTLSFYSARTMFSGTPIYDQWVIAMLNFIAFFPIVFTGAFDRDLEKGYIRNNPQVYASGPRNEFMNLRMTYRWVSTVLIHTFVICLLGMPSQTIGGGQTSAFTGLMRGVDPNYPGEGEGGDLQSVGVVMFTILIITLAWKVSILYVQFVNVISYLGSLTWVITLFSVLSPNLHMFKGCF